MTAYSRERANGVPTRWSQTAITVHGETVVIEHRSLGGHEIPGCFLIADEAGSAEWLASKGGGSKVELIRTRQLAHDRLTRAKLAQTEYVNAVRSGDRTPCADTRHSLRMAILEAEKATLEAYLAR